MPELAHVLEGLGDGPVLVLSEASTEIERAAIRAAVAERLGGSGSDNGNGSGRGVELVEVADGSLSSMLDRDDVTVVPVRVAWLPPERDGQRRAGVRELLVLEDPRNPRPRTQARLVNDPDRHRVIAGEAARIGELRTRWTEVTGGRGGLQAFADFVRRQAGLALERAERSVTGERYKVPRHVVEQIAASARFRDGIARLARELDRAPEDVMAEAVDALDDVVAAQSPLAMDAFDLLTRPLFQRGWDIEVDRSQLADLRELNRELGLIFLPVHRSYVDPLVLGRVLHDAGFPRNHTPGGANLAFWPVAPIARRAGIIFIPRSLKGEPVKKFVLREYLGFLAAKRFNLEWYMEAGRSRTGKLRPPRFGLLQFVVDALTSGRLDDVALVPVSITYDRLPEVDRMAAEEQGAAKQPEGLRWLANYWRGNAQPLGTVHVRFADPLSLRDGLATYEERGADARLAMQRVGFEVFNRINSVTPITPMALVTLALLGVGGRALTDDEVLAQVSPYVAYIDRRELPLVDRSAVTDVDGIRRTLARLEAAGIVSRYGDGIESVFVIEPGQHHAAAYYRNSAIHWFVNRAIGEVAVALAAEDPGDDPMETVWQHCLAIRDLLKFEFFFSDRRTFLAQMEEERELMAVDGDGPEVETDGARDVAAHVLGGQGFLAAPIVLRPFLEAYYVVGDRLAARDPRRALDEKRFVAECAAVGRQYLLQQRLRNPEGVSPELFASALGLVANRDLYDPGREPVAEGRRAFAEEVATILHGVDVVERIDRDRRAATTPAVPGAAGAATGAADDG